MTHELETIARAWPSVRTYLAIPGNKKEYNRQVSLLDELIDEIGEDESHPLASLMETLGSLIEAYESARIPEPEGDPVQVLNLLLEEHGLRQSDLPEIGSQGVVSEILTGKRRLNLRQIKAVSQRFGISAATLI